MDFKHRSTSIKLFELAIQLGKITVAAVFNGLNSPPVRVAAYLTLIAALLAIGGAL